MVQASDEDVSQTTPFGGFFGQAELGGVPGIELTEEVNWKALLGKMMIRIPGWMDGWMTLEHFLSV